MIVNISQAIIIMTSGLNNKEMYDYGKGHNKISPGIGIRSREEGGIYRGYRMMRAALLTVTPGHSCLQSTDTSSGLAGPISLLLL